MKRIQRKTERRISAALRLALVALLLLLQIVLVIVLVQVLRQKMYIGYTVLQMLGVLCVLHLYMRPGSSTYKPGWIILIMLVPVVGLILYFLWNGNQVKKKLALKAMAMPKESPAVQESSTRAQAALTERWPRWGKLTEYLQRQNFPVFANTEMTYFPTGEAYLEDLLAKMEKARRFIFLEYYIASEGQIWERICRILTERAAAGVEVNLILDDFGSMMTMPPENIYALRQKGIWVQMFNPVHHYVNRLYFNYRDHRKIFVIDGRVGFTGGVNLADEYINHVEKYGRWKDAAIMLEGEAVRSMTALFLQMWSILKEPEFEAFLADPIPAPAQAQGTAAPYGDCPLDGERVGEMVYIDLLNRARKYIHIMTPYLILDGELETALKFAAERGVDVHLILPGVPDKRFPYALAKTHYSALLDSGVKISEWTPGFVHAKVFVVDDREAVVGTINLDYRSLYHHFENAVWVTNAPCIRNIESDFQATLEECRAVSNDPKSIWQGKHLLRATGMLMKVIAPLL